MLTCHFCNFLGKIEAIFSITNAYPKLGKLQDLFQASSSSSRSIFLPQSSNSASHQRTTWFGVDSAICHEYGLETQTNRWQTHWERMSVDFASTLFNQRIMKHEKQNYARAD